VKQITNFTHLLRVDAIDPFVLKKRLAKFDYFNQMSRLEQAVKAFEVMLSKSTMSIEDKTMDPKKCKIDNQSSHQDRQPAEKQTECDPKPSCRSQVVTSDRSQTYHL
jgi:hypothetical protein